MDTLVAMFANALVSCLLLTQLVRLFKGRKARHLSIGLLLLLLPATLCWAAFGWMEGRNLMFICSIGTAFLNLLTLMLYISSSRHLRTNS